MNDILTEKSQRIQRCVLRAREEYAASDDFSKDFTHQDAAILNILRACEQAIDLANYVVTTEKLGIPATNSEAFDLLARSNVISTEIADKLKRMVQFRNVVIHQYTKTDLAIVVRVIESGLDDLIAFADRVHAQLRKK